MIIAEQGYIVILPDITGMESRPFFSQLHS